MPGKRLFQWDGRQGVQNRRDGSTLHPPDAAHNPDIQTEELTSRLWVREYAWLLMTLTLLEADIPQVVELNFKMFRRNRRVCAAPELLTGRVLLPEGGEERGLSWIQGRFRRMETVYEVAR